MSAILMQRMSVVVALACLACTGTQQSIGNHYSAEQIYRQELQHFPFIQLASSTAPADIAEFKQLIYRDKLLLDVYAPATTMNELRPGIVLAHGGDWHSGDRSHVAPLAIQLALRGYVVATVQYRLAPAALYPAAVEDVQAAVGWMRSHAQTYGIDATHIALAGVGAGATIAALAGLTADDPHVAAQAILSLDGPWHFDSTMPVRSETHISDPVSGWLGGTADQQGERWHNASPSNHIRKDVPPVLLLNSGASGYNSGQEELLRRLAHFRIPHRVEQIPASPHTFWLFEPWVSPAANIMADFLDLQFKYRMTCH